MNQGNWYAALLNPDVSSPEGLITWNNSSTAQRFTVYRNNVAASLVEALASTFPVSRTLVGEEFFDAMALEFIRQCPPGSPILALYGRAFPSFIKNFPPAQGVPYLAAVARLERTYVDIFHAVDGEGVNPVTLMEALSTPQQMARVTINLRPTIAILRSPYPVVSLWHVHRSGGNMAVIELTSAENAYIARVGLSVSVSARPDGFCEFINMLNSGKPLLDTTNDVLEIDPTFDLTQSLTTLIQDQAIESITILD